MGSILEGKNVILGVTGGIAAYKSVELLRLLTGAGADVRVIMTRNARRFVAPLTFEALCKRPVFDDLFAGGRSAVDASIRHIEWAQEADAVVIAPATANILGKLAGGIADDALSTFILAVDAPIVLCPSMNSQMYVSRPVQRNLTRLKEDGYRVLTPDSGQLACGTTGPGRLPEPSDIVDRVAACLTPKDLNGKQVVVTAGPTWEPIDPVRYITNPSSGKMGFAIARAAEHRGAKTTLITGPTSLANPPGVTVVRVETADEMADAVFSLLAESDILIKAAAVSDYRVTHAAEHKIKKSREVLELSLEKNVDILKEAGRRKTSQFLVGFAAETQHLQANAEIKLKEKNSDIIVGNLVGRPDSGFGSDTNKVTFFYRNGDRETIPSMAKDEVAHVLFDRIVEQA